MKKQIISFVLAACMLVAMIPAMAVSTAAATNDTIYDVPLTDVEINVDGVCDDVYKLSDKMESKKIYTYSQDGLTGKESGAFVAYAAATAKGLYVWADVTDYTFTKKPGETTGQGDFIQFYYNMGAHNHDVSDGYISVDYNGGTYCRVAGAVGVPLPEGAKTAYTKYDTGYTAEIFIPWRPGSYAEFAMDYISAPVKVGLGIQVSDDTTGNNYRDAVGYDSAVGGNYWSDYKLLSTLNIESDKFYSTKYVAEYGADMVLDGVIDTAYLAGTKVDISTKWSGTHANAKGNGFAYYAFTNDAIWFIAEIKDNTVTASKEDGVNLYIDLTNIDTKLKDNTYDDVYDAESKVLGRITVNPVTGAFDNRKSFTLAEYKAGGKYEVKAASVLTEDGYRTEICIPLSDTLKEKIANTSYYHIGASLEVKDDIDNNGSRDGIYYDNSKSGGTWEYYSDVADIYLNKKIGEIPVADAGLSFNYSINLGKDLLGATIRYTIETKGDTVVIDDAGKYNSKTGNYEFSFPGVVPYNMADSLVTIALVYDGKVRTSEGPFTVYDNCLAKLDKTALENGLSENQNVAMKKYVYDILNYSAATQKYLESLGVMEFDSYLNEGYENMGSYVTEYKASGDIVVSEALKGYENTEFVSAGVYFDSDNRMYFKFKTDADIEKIRVNIGGGIWGVAAQDLAILETEEEGVYIVYTDVIKAEDYDRNFTLRICYVESEYTTTIVQSVKCNVNAYLVEIIETSTNAAMVELAKAAYIYGVSASAYAAA